MSNTQGSGIRGTDFATHNATVEMLDIVNMVALFVRNPDFNHIFKDEMAASIRKQGSDIFIEDYTLLAEKLGERAFNNGTAYMRTSDKNIRRKIAAARIPGITKGLDRERPGVVMVAITSVFRENAESVPAHFGIKPKTNVVSMEGRRKTRTLASTTDVVRRAATAKRKTR